MPGTCSVTCGGGIQIDSRQPSQEALFDGNPCEGEATSEIECNTNVCLGKIFINVVVLTVYIYIKRNVKQI